MKITPSYGPKMSIGCHFFAIFHEKITAVMPIFGKKNVHSLKTYRSHAHILSKIRPSSQKHGASCHLSQIFHKKTPVEMPIFGQKCKNSVNTTHYYGLKKSIGNPFYQIFTKKKTLLSCPYVVKKTQIF